MTDDDDPPPAAPYRGKGEECGWCRFCGDDFRCRRRAPLARLTRDETDESEYYAVWPMVAYYDWCGEFEGWTHAEMDARPTGPGDRPYP